MSESKSESESLPISDVRVRVRVRVLNVRVRVRVRVLMYQIQARGFHQYFINVGLYLTRILVLYYILVSIHNLLVIPSMPGIVLGLCNNYAEPGEG